MNVSITTEIHLIVRSRSGDFVPAVARLICQRAILWSLNFTLKNVFHSLSYFLQPSKESPTELVMFSVHFPRTSLDLFVRISTGNLWKKPKMTAHSEESGVGSESGKVD